MTWNKVSAAVLLAVALFPLAMLVWAWGTPTASGEMFVGRVHVDAVRSAMCGLMAFIFAWAAHLAYHGKL